VEEMLFNDGKDFFKESDESFKKQTKIKKNKMAGGRQITASSSLLMTFQKLP
jgi:hypothetical protein